MDQPAPQRRRHPRREPYTIVGGVPARQIRERFNRTIAARLAQIAWWNWPTETIWLRLPEFQSGDVEAFCARWI